MRYIVHTAVETGRWRLPVGTVCESDGAMIRFQGVALCAEKSLLAHLHMARDDDGRGLTRGRLTTAIRAALDRRDKGYQARWDRVWADPVCQPYRRKEFADHWLWNHDFYNAPVDDLRHIAALVGAKEE